MLCSGVRGSHIFTKLTMPNIIWCQNGPYLTFLHQIDNVYPWCQIVYGVKLSGVKLFVFTHGVKLSGVKLSAALNCPRCQIDLQQILGTLCRSTPPALLRLCLRGRSVHPVAGSSPLSRSSGTAPALLMLPTFTRPSTYILCFFVSK